MRSSYCSHRLSVVLAALAVAGCETAVPRAATVVDSAGVEIVTHAGVLDALPQLRLADAPFEIGGAGDRDVVLFGVSSVVPLAGGRVAIGLNGPPQVQLFGPDANHIATIGRPGEGPGEFSVVGSILPLPGDSLAVWDPNRRRVSVFTFDGRLQREVDLREVAPPTVAAAPNTSTDAGYTHLLPGSEGSWFLFTEGVFSSGDATGIFRPALPAVRLSPAGATEVQIGSLPGMTMHSGGPLGTVPLPLGARTYAVASEGKLVVGTAETPEFRLFADNGDLARIVRWADGSQRSDDQHLSAWWAFVDSVPGTRDLMELMPRPPALPAYDGLIGSENGDVLVAEFAGPIGVWPTRRGEPVPEMMKPARRVLEQRWLVFGPDGVLKAFIITPDGFEPYAIRDDQLWGVYVDDLDVESVRAYRIVE